MRRRAVRLQICQGSSPLEAVDKPNYPCSNIVSKPCWHVLAGGQQLLACPEQVPQGLLLRPSTSLASLLDL